MAYRLTPHRIVGSERVSSIEFRRSGTDEAVSWRAGLTSIGYRGKPIAGLPFDETAGVVPNQDGRVVDPADGKAVAGAYVAGWIKRGPIGFIGTNKSCAMQTVSRLVDDFNEGLLTDPDGRARRPGAHSCAPVAGGRRRGGLACHRRGGDRSRGGREAGLG